MTINLVAVMVKEFLVDLYPAADAVKDAIRHQSEAEFTWQVRKLARTMGWLEYHTYNSRRSTAGFPDLVLVREPFTAFVELKTEKGKLSEAQKSWLMGLQGTAEHADNVWVWLWRPSDLPGIHRFLNTPDQFDSWKDDCPVNTLPYLGFKEAVTSAINDRH